MALLAEGRAPARTAGHEGPDAGLAGPRSGEVEAHLTGETGGLVAGDAVGVVVRAERAGVVPEQLVAQLAGEAVGLGGAGEAAVAAEETAA